MMSVLEKIVAGKKSEVKESKRRIPYTVLEKSDFFGRQPLSLKAALEAHGSPGIIAEFKRKSPSAGWLNRTSLPADVCESYRQAGARAVSVLTDSFSFGGSLEDLKQVRAKVGCPVLRKDFIIDEYQVVEAKAAGADAILLIAEVLDAVKMTELFMFADSLGLDVLVEIHDEKSIPKLPPDAGLIGINSRDLGSFSVSLDYAGEMISFLPSGVIKIAESGIRSSDDYKKMKAVGFDASLIGGLFMQSDDPGGACKNFIKECSE